MTPSGRKRRRDCYLGLWVTTGEYVRLKRAAAEADTTMSELLRRAIPDEPSNDDVPSNTDDIAGLNGQGVEHGHDE